MFIKFTRFDGAPIWLNAAFVVTVEPRRGGGSIVVPIGDGLDYEVQESPEAVLALLEGVQAAQVVPVPAPEMLTKRPEDVSAEPLTMSAADADSLDVPKGSVAKVQSASSAKAKAPAKKKSSKAKTKRAAVLSEELVARLRKLVPRTKKKLVNTIMTQFKVADVDAAVAELEERGEISLEREHVIWKSKESAQ